MSYVSTGTLKLERAGNRLTVTLNRPQVRNAMSRAMVKDLTEVIARAGSDASLRTVVLRGAGGNFCAGGDLSGFAAQGAQAASADEVAASNRVFGALLSSIEQMPQAVVAVVQGAVLAGGFGLASVADIVIAQDGALFGMTEVAIGLVPAQIAPFVARRIGSAWARTLIVSAQRIDAAQAERIGFVQYREPDAAALEQRAEQLLAQIERCGPQAIAASKRILTTLDEQALPIVLDQAAQAFATALLGQEGREGVAAFLEKRAPKWTQSQSDTL